MHWMEVLMYHAQGRLQHHFWGTYAATIVLAFVNAGFAEAALPSLPGWQVHPTFPRALVFHGSGDALKATERLLVSFGADKQKMTSLAKSIDYGEPFTVSVPDPAAPQQASLFEVA